MKINIKCQSDTTLNLEQLTEFQGNLKFRTVTDTDRLTDSILQYGFSFPFFVWHDNGTNNVIDGHGRLETLRNLAKNGYEVPPLPVVYIRANSRDEAKNLLLRVNSLYGDIDRDELIALIEEAGARAEDLSFPDVSLDFLNEPQAGREKDSGEENDDGIFEPTLDPTIDTDDVDERDIEKAEEKLADIKKDHEFVEFICRGCGSKIYVKRETIIRYLKGESV